MESEICEQQLLLPSGVARAPLYRATDEKADDSVCSLSGGGLDSETKCSPDPIEARRRHESKVLLGALIFCFIFMIVEFVFGVVAHSLALLTDASHLLIDVGAYALSVASLRAASRSSCGKYSYGWHRAEVIGTLVSVFSIWALVVWIVIEGLSRSWSVVKCSRIHAAHRPVAGGGHRDFSSTAQPLGFEGEGAFTEAMHMEMCKSIDSYIMVVVGLLGIFVNLACAAILYFGGSHGHSHFGGSHSHSHGGHAPDEHDAACVSGKEHSHGGDECHDPRPAARGFAVHAALLHALGDCVQSLGVILAGVFICAANHYSFGVLSYRYSIYNLADPLCSLLFAAITLNMTRPLLRDLFGILMESTPPGVDYAELQTALQRIRGVEGVHDLHVWSIASDYVALSVHLEADNKDTALQEAREVCRRFGVSHTTIQVDTVEDGAGLCPSACGQLQPSV